MRNFIFVISLFSLSFVIAPEKACSQNMDSALPEVDVSEPPPPTEDKDVSFDLATDEQLQEAQSFYESCKNNATMSSQKNCKCAAAAFLETRVKLGKSATVEEIMQENVNTCLLDDEEGTITDTEDLDLEEVTEQQMREAEEVQAQCMNDKDMKRAVDCECLAAKFLDLRMKRGPIPSKNILIAEIAQTSCRNIVDTTGMEYTRCMKGTGFKYRDIRPKDYCECYARMWGKLFEGYEGRMDEYKKSSIRMRARAYCFKPEAYKDEEE